MPGKVQFPDNAAASGFPSPRVKERTIYPVPSPLPQLPSTTKRLAVWSLRLGIVVLVCLCVSGTVRRAWVELRNYQFHLEFGWLFAAGVLYLVGLTAMAWYWRAVLAAMDQPVPLLAAARAYFLGHLGKYVPGKAMAVVLRVAAVRRWVPSMRIGLMSCLIETLTMMATGALFVALVMLVVLRSDLWLGALGAGAAIALGAPTLPPLVRWLMRVGMKATAEQAALTTTAPAPRASLEGYNYGVLAEGWICGAVCWLFLAWSLWATLRGIGVDQVSPISDLPNLIAAIAFAVVAGFASLLPGGLGVRDAVLMQLLAPICGDAGALVAAILARLVWLVSEVVACGILYTGAGTRKNPT